MNNIQNTMKYLLKTCQHKYFVFMAGLKTKAPIWRLLIHDWTKFLPAEAPHYGRRFYGDNSDPLGYVKAWIHHVNSNPHHWEYWIPITTSATGPYKAGEPVPMPEWAVREMVADWLGSEMAKVGKYPDNLNSWDWFQQNNSSFKLHSETAELLDKVLNEFFKR